MPTLGNALDFNKYQALNFRAHNASAITSPVAGQLWFNTSDNTLYWYDGGAWIPAKDTGAGSAPDATTSSKGIVQLAGDLAGTAASPQIAAGAVTHAEVAAANKDGANATPGMRTLNIGVAGAAMDSTASLNDQVNVVPVDGDVGFAGFKVRAVGDPATGTDAVNKQYVDGIAQGLAPKDSVRVATTANIVISTALNSGDVIDGITLANGDRVLVKNQTSSQENGIYVVAASPARAADMDAWSEVPAAFTFVEQGTVNADTGWVCTVDTGGTLGATGIDWAQFSAAGQIDDGAGLVKTGNSIGVGGGAGVQVNADSVQVANNGITNAMLADGAVDLNSADVTNTLPVGKGGTGGTTAATARTALGTPSVFRTFGPGSTGTTWSVPQSVHLCSASRQNIVQISDATSGAIELPDIAIAANGDVTVTWGASVNAASKLITVVG